jgi:hypothetical protein
MYWLDRMWAKLTLQIQIVQWQSRRTADTTVTRNLHRTHHHPRSAAWQRLFFDFLHVVVGPTNVHLFIRPADVLWFFRDRGGMCGYRALLTSQCVKAGIVHKKAPVACQLAEHVRQGRTAGPWDTHLARHAAAAPRNVPAISVPFAARGCGCHGLGCHQTHDDDACQQNATIPNGHFIPPLCEAESFLGLIFSSQETVLRS